MNFKVTIFFICTTLFSSIISCKKNETRVVETVVETNSLEEIIKDYSDKYEIDYSKAENYDLLMVSSVSSPEEMHSVYSAFRIEIEKNLEEGKQLLLVISRDYFIDKDNNVLESGFDIIGISAKFIKKNGKVNVTVNGIIDDKV